jgi:prevent-host-death family protein
MAVTANIHEAKTTLSKLIERALAGEEVIIAKAGKPLVELKPVVAAGQRDLLAAFAPYQGKVILDEDWEQSEWDDQALAALYGYSSVEEMHADQHEPQRAVAEPASRCDPK